MHQEGHFPLEKFCGTYPAEKIHDAINDMHTGRVTYEVLQQSIKLGLILPRSSSPSFRGVWSKLPALLYCSFGSNEACTIDRANKLSVKSCTVE